eukprot:c252_g1_i1.p1 GENE.c252_g1_i1~~c252_g1_i1.p1  ORF type:complete len:329 (+),score=79.50 c252_g1_i1:64-1050(+)
MTDVPKFSLYSSRFDESTFWGRLNQIMVQLDPMKLLLSDKEVDDAVALVQAYKEGKQLPKDVGDLELWRAKEIAQCLTHPDDGQKIFRLFCFAAYTPMQPPIVIGMLWPGAGVANQLFWQWYNQSYNSMVFYANKNKSTPMSDSDVVKAYVGATSVAMGLALGVQKLGAVLGRRGGAIGTMVTKSAPFIATVGAGWASLLLMRKDEITHGVLMRDDQGNVYGKSQNAATEGIVKCCAARVFWNIPLLVFTPVIMSAYYKTRIHAARPQLNIPMQVVTATAMTCLGVYPAQAVFSQTASVPAARLEPRFQNIRNAKGEPINTFFYNKGL